METTILVVEDDPDLVEPMADILPRNFRFLVATSVRDAESIIEGDQIDFALVDLFLAGNQHGSALEPLLRARNIPFAYMSGQPGAHFTKPFHPADLLTFVLSRIRDAA